MKQLTSVCVVAMLLGTVAFNPQRQAFASQSVDPNSLNPPATLFFPPGTTITCQATGTGTICRGQEVDSETNADTRISCGSFEILETDTFVADRTFRYDQSGNLIEFVGHASDTGTLINSVTGKSIQVMTHRTVTITFSTPGNLDTGTWTYNGNLNTVTAPGIGLVTHDVGTVTFDQFRNIIREGGPHDFFDNFAGFQSSLCAALA